VYLSDTFSDLQKHYSGDSWNDVGNNVYGNVKQLFLLKQKNRNLKTLLSVGGWSYSSNFAQAASTDAGRSNFANSTLTLIKDLGFDGVDIDWEYPADSTEAQNFVLLLKTTRDALDAYAQKYSPGYRLLLSVAAPAGPSSYQYMKFGEMDQYIDMWNLMAYDYAGSWDTVSGHQANWNPSTSSIASTPFSTYRPITDYIKAGVTIAKINIGIPLYARGFMNTNGPGQSYSGTGPGTWEAGIYDFKTLPQKGATEAFSPTMVAGWSYDNVQKVFMSYDTHESAWAKAKCIQTYKLGGAMYWELSADKSGNDSLINTVSCDKYMLLIISLSLIRFLQHGALGCWRKCKISSITLFLSMTI
jgi:chitinase